jgi:hypothetical protein
LLKVAKFLNVGIFSNLPVGNTFGIFASEKIDQHFGRGPIFVKLFLFRDNAIE